MVATAGAAGLAAGRTAVGGAGEGPALGAARVLVLSQYAHDSSPGQRFRYEQYLGWLREAGVEVEVAPFLDAAPAYLHRGGVRQKAVAFAWAVAGRLRLARTFKHYDRIFIFRDAAPLGPPLIEWLAVRSGVPVVYDIDDAVFIAKTAKANRALRWLKFPGRARYLARHAERVMVCNPFLADWASRYCRNVMLTPTTVDLAYHRTARARSARAGLPVLGWTGSNTTTPYLDLIRPALLQLQEEFEFEFRVICDVDPGFAGLRHYRFVPWRKATEIADLDALDIGLMPVPAGTWEMGKVGFKAIQYGAMEIAAVASETGSGREVVEDGVTGRVVENTTAAWVAALRRLLTNPAEAVAMGRAAHRRIAERYSVEAQRGNYLKAFTGAELA